MLILSLDQFHAPPPSQLAAWFLRDNHKRPMQGGIWTIRNELRPADLYAYLYARFGPPNGIQNFLRRKGADNLIHWEWTLQHTHGLLSFLGLNQRTEIHFIGQWDFHEYSRDQAIASIKADFSRFGKRMSEIRRDVFEDWERLLNPYQNLRLSIDRMHRQLRELEVGQDEDRFGDPDTMSETQQVIERVRRMADRYTQAFGLATSLASLTPVLAESFINLVMFILLKPEIEENERLRENAKRAPIDIKVQSLHLNCIGFQSKVDWSTDPCRSYNRVINERNDLLHGNIVPSKLKVGEVYFHDDVPVFKEYTTLWEKSFGTSLRACEFSKVDDMLQAVNEFIAYVLSCLEPDVAFQVRMIMGRKEFGRNITTGRLGVLFPNHVIDIQMSAIAKP